MTCWSSPLLTGRRWTPIRYSPRNYLFHLQLSGDLPLGRLFLVMIPSFLNREIWAGTFRIIRWSSSETFNLLDLSVNLIFELFVDVGLEFSHLDYRERGLSCISYFVAFSYQLWFLKQLVFPLFFLALLCFGEVLYHLAFFWNPEVVRLKGKVN